MTCGLVNFHQTGKAFACFIPHCEPVPCIPVLSRLRQLVITNSGLKLEQNLDHARSRLCNELNANCNGFMLSKHSPIMEVLPSELARYITPSSSICNKMDPPAANVNWLTLVINLYLPTSWSSIFIARFWSSIYDLSSLVINILFV